MHNITPTPISARRLARFVTWAQAMCAWLAAMLFTGAAPTRRRRKRYSMFALMPRFIECLLVIRASASLRLRTPGAARPHNTPAGATRRTRTRAQILRAAIGADMRRRLRPQDLCARFAIWFDALRNLDAFAAPLVRRAKRRLTRLNPIVATRPAPVAIRSTNAVAAPQAADTS